MTVPELILEALRVLDVDQAGLAKRLKRGQPTVSRWLSGDSKPDYESCLRLAQITGMSATSVLETVGLDPDLIPPNPGAVLTEVQLKRQSIQDQVNGWLTAVGPENEAYFWAHIKAQGDSTERLIRDLRTAVNVVEDTAINPPVNERGKRGRRPRKDGDGPLTMRQHGVGERLADRRIATGHHGVMVERRRAA